MDVILLTLFTLIIMYATLRSPAFGIGGAVVILTGAALVGWKQSDWLPLVSGGLLMGLMARARVTPAVAILGTGGVVGILFAGFYLLADQQTLREELLTLLTSQPPRLPGASAADLNRVVDLVIDWMPAIMVLTEVVSLALAYAIAVRVFPRFGLSLRRATPLASCRLPFAVIWVFAASLLLVVFGRRLELRPVEIAGLNLCLLFAAAFAVLGIAVLRHAMNSRGLPGRAQVVIGLLAAPVLLFVLLPLMVLGLLDMWLDFRRLESAEKGA